MSGCNLFNNALKDPLNIMLKIIFLKIISLGNECPLLGHFMKHNPLFSEKCPLKKCNSCNAMLLCGRLLTKTSLRTF